MPALSASAQPVDKPEWRAKLLAQRADLPRAGSAGWAENVLKLLANAETVACYASVRPEPDTNELLARLHQNGIRVLLPKLHDTPDWAWYDGPDRLEPGPHRIPQPVSAGLGAAALTRAQAIVLPGLAGTPTGKRLGTGGGWYDRALEHANPDAPRILLLHDTEILEDLPTDPWDQPVDYLVTPIRVITCGEL